MINMAEDIELVIKVPERVYKTVTHIECDASLVVNEMRESIANGIPLPKGHGRLIDIDKTISKICGNSCGCHLEECGYDKPCDSVARLNAAPTIIEADKE